MKKLSLILALVLVLACCVFAACTEEGDTSSEAAASSEAASTPVSEAESEAESEAASEAESEAASEAESEAVSEDATSEDTSEEASAPEASEPEITGDNLAKGKSYTVSGCGTGSAQYTADLTDGTYATAMSYDNNWFAFYYNDGAKEELVNAPNFVGYVIIDLGEATDISAIRLNLINDSGAGVPAPKKVTVSLSTDSESFGDAVSMPIEATDKTAYWSEGAIEGNAQYVKIEFTLDGVFAFVNEIEVYA